MNPAHQPFQSDQSNFARPALSPFGSKESFSPAVVHSQTPSTSDKIHLRDLFTASPGRPSIDSDQGNSASGHGNRRSFAGQPMIDDTLLHGGAYKGFGGIDEFGQTMRSVSGEVSSSAGRPLMKGDIRDSWIKESKFRNGLIPLWSLSPLLRFIRYSFRRTREIGGRRGSYQKRSRVKGQVRFL